MLKRLKVLKNVNLEKKNNKKVEFIKIISGENERITWKIKKAGLER